MWTWIGALVMVQEVCWLFHCWSWRYDMRYEISNQKFLSSQLWVCKERAWTPCWQTSQLDIHSNSHSWLGKYFIRAVCFLSLHTHCLTRQNLWLPSVPPLTSYLSLALTNVLHDPLHTITPINEVVLHNPNSPHEARWPSTWVATHSKQFSPRKRKTVAEWASHSTY